MRKLTAAVWLGTWLVGCATGESEQPAAASRGAGGDASETGGTGGTDSGGAGGAGGSVAAMWPWCGATPEATAISHVWVALYAVGAEDVFVRDAMSSTTEKVVRLPKVCGSEAVQLADPSYDPEWDGYDAFAAAADGLYAIRDDQSQAYLDHWTLDGRPRETLLDLPDLAYAGLRERDGRVVVLGPSQFANPGKLVVYDSQSHQSAELATEIAEPGEHVIDADWVYWVDAVGLHRVPIAGGPVEMLTTVHLRDLVVSGGFIYAFESYEARIVRLPVSGGEPTVVAGSLRLDYDPGFVAGGFLYFGSDDGVGRIPVGGGDIEWLPGPPGRHHRLQTDGVRLFSIDPDAAELWVRPL